CSPRASRTRLWKDASWRNRKRLKRPPPPPSRRRPVESRSKSLRASLATVAPNLSAAIVVSVEGAEAAAETVVVANDAPRKQPRGQFNLSSVACRLLRSRRSKLWKQGTHRARRRRGRRWERPSLRGTALA